MLPEKSKGPETIAEVTCPVPFPVRRPPRVVLPVPPKLVASVVVAMTEPSAFVVRSAEGTPEMANCEVVALPAMSEDEIYRLVEVELVEVLLVVRMLVTES